MGRVSVCMVVANYPPHGGGSERQCALLARHLARRGVRVTVLTRRLDDAPRLEDQDGVEIHRLGSPRSSRWLQAGLFSVATMAQLLRRRRRFQIVHCHGFEPLALTGAMAQRLLGKRLVVKVVTSGTYGDLARLSALPAWKSIAEYLARADAVVVLNDEARRELAAIDLDANKIHMIPNGVEIPTWQREPNPSGALFCGRLTAQKNVAGLLRAWAHTRTARALHLDIVGDGPDRPALERLAHQLGVEASVRFHGRQASVAPFYQRAACAVLFSHAEGLSNAVLEALAAGIPVIGSDIPGIREIVRNEETGLLVPAGDEAALAEAIDRMLGDPPAAERMGRAGRDLIASHYHIETIAATVQSLYERLEMP